MTARILAGPRPARVGRRQRPLKLTGLYLAAVTAASLILVPIGYGVLGGFKDNAQLTTNPIGLPTPWITANYTDILGSPNFWRPVANSTLIALGATLTVVAIGSLAAFVLARYAFKGREAVFMLFSVGLMFPFAVAILPLFVMLRALDLLNNPLGVILPQAAFQLPVTIIILRGFFRSIPAELEEAATIDGCTPFGFFWRVLLPMARPALAVVSVLALVMSWNNYLLPLVVLFDQQWWTLPLGVTQFQGQYTAELGRVLAYVTLAMVPALAFYALAERQIVGGLSTGAIKG